MVSLAECWLSLLSMQKHALAKRIWGHAPRKSLKIFPPEIESGSGFDWNYRTVAKCCGSAAWPLLASTVVKEPTLANDIHTMHNIGSYMLYNKSSCNHTWKFKSAVKGPYAMVYDIEMSKSTLDYFGSKIKSQEVIIMCKWNSILMLQVLYIYD